MLPPSVQRRLRKLWDWVRGRLADRPDSEHEQAIIRLVVMCGMYAYMLLAPFPADHRPFVLFWSTVLFLAGIAAGLGIFAHILWKPGISPTRRLVGIVVDAAGINTAMLIGGLLTTPFYPLLLWIIFGHGFRYGNRYLFAAAGLSLVMFGFVLFTNQELRPFSTLDVALVLSLIVLPGYVSVLLKKLTDALYRAEAASRAKSRFLATMSHEFRTPLNAILGTTELLERGTSEAKRREAATTIETAARSLLNMVDMLLRLARIESGRTQVENTRFNLDAFVLRLLAMVRPTAIAKGIDLRWQLEPAVPVIVEASEESLEHALLNLLANAVKFTQEGSVVLHISARSGDDGGRFLRFEVRDTGIGIPAEARARIFERFAQADEETRVRFGGTGLGLAIARELVELMGGHIGVDSTLGKGSTFWFEIPIGRDEPAEETPAAPDGSLVVLGNALASLTLAQRLEALGMAVRIAANPASALEALARLEGRRAVVAIPPTTPAELGALARRMRDELAGEPVAIVTLGIEGAEHGAPIFAALPADAEDRALLRVLRAALHSPLAPAPAADAAPAQTTAARILLAEDNRVNQKVIARLLEKAGHEVEVVDNGQAVLDRLEEGHYDLVILDVNMPDVSGPEVVKLLRFTSDPATLPPIVALSADATPETRDYCLSLGFSRYLTKPVNRTALERTVAELVPESKRHGQRPARPPQAGNESVMAQEEEPFDDKVVPHPALARSEAEGVLDRRRLQQIAQLDPDASFVEGLVRDFLEDGETLVGALLAAAEKGDVRAWREAAHALKSMAAHIGARALWTRTREWRNLDDHALQMRAAAEARAIADEFARARAALQKYLRSRAS